ncbi:MAG TPA: hypothetical protein VH561_06505 [Micromonosporaceae bacterium]|jgi:uncharacterized membrane protein YhaH (DUF805 family)
MAQTPARRDAGVDVPSGAPVTLRIAVWLLAAETGVLGLLAVFLTYAALTFRAQSAQGAVGIIVFVVVVAVVLGAAARALHQRRAWSRGPAIVLHMFLLPLGIATASGGEALLGAGSIILGVAGCALLLAPATRVAVGRG